MHLCPLSDSFCVKREKLTEKKILFCKVIGSILLCINLDAGEIFKVKKSSVSRRLVKMKNREKKNKEKTTTENKLQKQPPALLVKQTNPVSVFCCTCNSNEVIYFDSLIWC